MAFDFTSFPIIETKRLRLREIHEGDLDAALAHWGDPEVNHFISDMPPIATEDDVRPILDWCIQVFSTKRGIRWAITLKDDPKDTLIGTCGFHRWDNEHRHVEVGYDLARAHWRQGIMTEAMTVVVDFCFNELNVHRVEADVTGGNIGSLAVLHKLGFQIEGTFRERVYLHDEYYDLWQFGLLRREWKALREKSQTL